MKGREDAPVLASKAATAPGRKSFADLSNIMMRRLSTSGPATRLGSPPLFFMLPLMELLFGVTHPTATGVGSNERNGLWVLVDVADS